MQKHFCYFLILVAACVFPLKLYAGVQDNALISTVEVRSNGVVIVVMETERTNYASCINATWHKSHWAFSAASTNYHKEFLSVALAAKSTGSVVKIQGTDDCSAFTSIETVDRIQIK